MEPENILSEVTQTQKNVPGMYSGYYTKSKDYLGNNLQTLRSSKNRKDQVRIFQFHLQGESK